MPLIAVDFALKVLTLDEALSVREVSSSSQINDKIKSELKEKLQNEPECPREQIDQITVSDINIRPFSCVFYCKNALFTTISWIAAIGVK